MKQMGADYLDKDLGMDGFPGSSNVTSKYKIVFLGDQSVGKTSLINRFMYDTFENSYQATIGIDFLSKPMYIDDKTIKLQLWDTAGQERFRSLIPSYIKDSVATILVYDITNRNSFNSIPNWINDVQGISGTDVIIILVGNKFDLNESRQVPEAEARKYAEENNILFFETSAKTGENVQIMFKKLAGTLPGLENAEAFKDPDIIDIARPNISPSVPSGGKKCC